MSYHYTTPLEVWCREICYHKPVSECYSHPQAMKFCFCLQTPLPTEPSYPTTTTEESITVLDKLCGVAIAKAEYSGPLSDYYCTHTCGSQLPISALSACAKDLVARFACLCDGVAMGPSVAPPENLPNSDKICFNVAPRSEFYR